MSNTPTTREELLAKIEELKAKVEAMPPDAPKHNHPKGYEPGQVYLGLWGEGCGVKRMLTDEGRAVALSHPVPAGVAILTPAAVIKESPDAWHYLGTFDEVFVRRG